jgi:hypothetical protein
MRGMRNPLGPDVDVTDDWRVRAEQPLLCRLTYLLRPAFAANHLRAMRHRERACGASWRDALPLLGHGRAGRDEPSA